MARKFAAVVFSLGCLHASSSLALGLGDLSLESFLNEPLKAEVKLLNTGNLHADQIRIRLATREDFERMGVERAYFLTSINFQVSQNDRGQPIIVMTSDDPVLEPYLDFIVEARWPTGRLLREYTVLVDPPLFDESAPVVSASQRVSEVEGIPLPGAEKKTAESVTTGTRVDVKKSNLAPGQMPDRDFNAEASDAPISGSRYMIHRDDTLWEIARRAKPEGTSVHQTMLDIQRLNPNAFIGGNINRIKAGYIIYLPTEGDISSQDLNAALAEVRQQNDDWQAGRASKPSSSGPSLRISADAQASDGDGSADAAGEYSAGASAAGEPDDSELERSEMASELASMEQQLETLQRIVNLKDDQIAALQAALEEAGETEAAAALAAAGESDEGMADEDATLDPAADDEGLVAEDTAAEEPVIEEPAVEEQAEVEVAAVPAPAPKPKPAPRPAPKPEPESGMMSYILYGLGALVLAILAFVFVRRRGETESDFEPIPAPAAAKQADDAFAEVELKDEPVEVEEDTAADAVEMEAAELEGEPEVALEDEPPSRDNRGYGEHKHDEYASDIDAGDALAEADIYIAYGRYPQAVDLLKTAIAAEPANSAYRLKLLEMFVQTDDLNSAEEQLRELEAIGDSTAIARAAQIFEVGKNAAGAAPEPSEAPDVPPMDLGDDPLESDFSGLAIEEPGSAQALSEELDLSDDFSKALGEEEQAEDLVIAAETDGMSTKLDLARAYLDMGDEDGARAILEEVTLEGNEGQKAEAASLLERIG